MVLFPVGRRWLSAIPFALALAWVLFGLAAPLSAGSSASVAGRVTEAVTGRRVEGVTVALFPSGDYSVPLTTVTDSRGRYRFDLLPAGRHVLSAVSSAGYLGELSDGRPCFRGLTFSERFGFRCDGVINDPPLTEVAAGETAEVPFALDRGGAIAGRVTAAADGAPVAARIAVTSGFGETLAEAVTGADGAFHAGPLPTGVYRVFTDTAGALADELWEGVHCDGRSPLFGLCDPRRGTPVAVHVRAVTDGIDFELQRLGTIAGRITASESGEPLADVLVIAQRDDGAARFARSGAGGRFVVAGLLSGDHLVTTLNAAERVNERWPEVPCIELTCTAAGTPLPVAIEQEVEGIDFALDPGGSISGTVTAEPTGEALDGVAIRMFAAAGTEWLLAAGTGPDGRYRLSGLPTGEYRLETDFVPGDAWTKEAYDGIACGRSGLCSAQAGVTPVAVTAGEETGGVDFTLEPPGAIAGRVVDAGTGQPLAGATVWLLDRRGGAEIVATDADGRYLAPGLARGVYSAFTERTPSTVEFIDELYDDRPCFARQCDAARGTPVEVDSGVTTGGIDFALRRGAAIEGRIVREDTGAPVSSVGVLAADGEGRFVAFAETGGDGRYRVPGLPDGGYRVATLAGPELIDEVHDRVQCIFGTGLGCEPLMGTAVQVEIGSPPPDLDFALASGFRPGTPCRSGPTRLCLAAGRFEVGIRHDHPGLGATAVRPISDTAGGFTFFADDNLEAVARVVDACASFDRFWVLAASLTGLGVEIGVRDAVSGEVRFYGGLDSAPALDTAAFASCEAGPVPPPVGAAASTESAAGVAGGCVPDATTFCLLGGRFAVSAEWDDGAGGSGAAGAVPLGDRSGYLWFHRPGSPEVGVKVLEACALDRPGHWVFASGLTTSEVQLTVTETVSGQSLEITNPLGQPFAPVRELDFFGGWTCPR